MKVHAVFPVALAGSRTALRVVVDGPGWLTVDDQRRFVLRRLDAVFLVRAVPRVRVRFRSLRGTDEQSVAVRVVAAPAIPAVPLVRRAPRANVPLPPAPSRALVVDLHAGESP